MSAQGARVVVADRNEALAQQTAAILKATAMAVDIGDTKSVERLFPPSWCSSAASTSW
jgi:NAD(P)-dependent dehydrogenase (short-subunit alcohol dehydrogenase family)